MDLTNILKPEHEKVGMRLETIAGHTYLWKGQYLVELFRTEKVTVPEILKEADHWMRINVERMIRSRQY